MKSKGKKHVAEQFPLIPEASSSKIRISFDLAKDEAQAFRDVLASYPADLGLSESQVAKMLLKLGMREHARGAR